MALANPTATPELEWQNVAIGLLFIGFNAILSHFLELGVGKCLVTASARCIVQLTLVSHLLERAFCSKNPRTALSIIVVLNVLAAFETVTNKCKRRYSGMLFVVLASLVLSTIPISYIGVRFALGVDPLSSPAKYIPIVGMLCGNTISRLQVSLGYVLEELSENRAKTEAYLGLGASRFEACKPIAKAALRLALTPSINQMSILGVISIPGTMTGAMLGGSSVEQAARLQMIVAFMLTASSTLATIIAVTCTLMVCVDEEDRVRSDRIYTRPVAFWRALITAASTVHCVISRVYPRKDVTGPANGPLPTPTRTEKLEPSIWTPVIAEANGCRHKIAVSIQMTTRRMRKSRRPAGRVTISETFASDRWRTGTPKSVSSAWVNTLRLSLIVKLFVPKSIYSKQA